ncbi:MAG: hypothetical protein KatS3mg112_1640 [Thermogutta sp.]|nr:MAG: hypothetical protein KatS3mg112_1640 [Thermogutta sp.]
MNRPSGMIFGCDQCVGEAIRKFPPPITGAAASEQAAFPPPKRQFSPNGQLENGQPPGDCGLSANPSLSYNKVFAAQGAATSWTTVPGGRRVYDQLAKVRSHLFHG